MSQFAVSHKRDAYVCMN